MNDQELILAGIDMDDFMKRLMGNTGLIKIFIQKFLEDDNFQKLTTAIEQHDIKQAETAAHTLKGMCGNLSLKKLFELFSEQVRCFRAGETEKAVSMLNEISEVYKQTTQHMQMWLAE